jgi:Ran GTPase-activating protein (RanGAP) involved in mRNA processing and transport
MHSINIVKEFPQIYHLEIKENNEKLMYDEAINQLTKNCDGIPLKDITSIKYFVNTWGLSSNNWFAENIIPKMTKLEKIDLSNTNNSKHRTDVGRGVQAILNATKGLKIKHVDISKNVMDGDGAKWLKDFIETTPTLKVLVAGSCKLQD